LFACGGGLPKNVYNWHIFQTKHTQKLSAYGGPKSMIPRPKRKIPELAQQQNMYNQ
jgi:hypothetical protein